MLSAAHVFFRNSSEILPKFLPKFGMFTDTLDMTENLVRALIQEGENSWIEFKRCGNGIENDVYETVCSFSNHFGGTILCGVLVSVISNPSIFSPTLMIEPEAVKIGGKIILAIQVPASSEVHTFKKSIYDRVFEADVKVSATSQIADMYIRKQNIFTEKKVFKYATLSELEDGIITKCRNLALTKNNEHPWRNMSDEEILKSTHLYGKDWQTGDEGMTLAGLLLLGREDVIMSVCPQYKTDALVRRVNLDRYDDRLLIYKNLVESYDILMQFAQKHLSDKFFKACDDRRHDVHAFSSA